MPSCADSLMLFFVHFQGSARTAPLRGPLGFTFLLENPQTKKVSVNGVDIPFFGWGSEGSERFSRTVSHGFSSNLYAISFERF